MWGFDAWGFDAIDEANLIMLVDSFDSGLISRKEFQERVRALPEEGILRISRILRGEASFLHGLREANHLSRPG
jgi:hypothetical protein